MKGIPLSTKGKHRGKYIALVDDEDYEYLNQWLWSACISRSFIYANRTVYTNGVKSCIKMHRDVVNTPEGMITDHIDHNGLNNQKSNLRVCTMSDNNRNRTSRGSSKYLGVSLDNAIRKRFIKKTNTWSYYRSSPRWIAQVEINDRNKRLGTFLDERDAAFEYDRYSKENNIEFTNLNFPELGIAGI